MTASARPKRPRGHPDAVSRLTRRILVVDDDEDVLSSMRDVLRFSIADAEVETASSGADALTFMADHGADALVTDYRMPGMDGLELAAAAHKARPRLPIVMVTAFNDREMEGAARDAGVGHVVHKPFDIDELVAAVESGLPAR